MVEDQKKPLYNKVAFLAEGPGFEPGPMESESTVLPLNYPSIRRGFYHERQGLAKIDYSIVEGKRPIKKGSSGLGGPGAEVRKEEENEFVSDVHILIDG